MKSRARRLGRDPDGLVILPGLVPVLGSTEAGARALNDELDQMIIPEYGLAHIAGVLEVPAGALELDKPLPAELLASRPQVQGFQSRAQLFLDVARRDNLTVRQLISLTGPGRGHRSIVGTPEQVADSIQEWFDGGAADGFNIMPPVLPSGLETFTEHVIPVLRRRGLLRTGYTGRTLREHYGIARPDSQFTADRGAVPEPVS